MAPAPVWASGRFMLAACLIVSVSVARSKDPRNSPEQVGHRDVGKGVNFYSLEKEIALGKEMVQDVERQAHIIEDSLISEYINRLGQNLVRNSDAKVPFTIKVLDDDEVNAFALPGGFLFVDSGLILKAGNEAELAGVMAHEIAHVAARHGTRQATRADLLNYASVPLIFMGGWTGYAIFEAANAAIPMGFLKFSRSFESEADRLGLQYMYNTGYDPESFVDFFEKIETLEKSKPGTLAKLFSAHPMTQGRIRAAQKDIQENLAARREYVLDTSEFDGIQKRLEFLEDRRKVDQNVVWLPALRHRPGSETAAGSGGESGVTKTGDGPPPMKRRN